MDPASPIAAGLASHPLTYLCAMLILVVIYLYKSKEGLQATLLQSVKDSAAEHRATLEKVLPLTEKLTNTVEVAERLLLKDGK
jgi:hypothetical protein